MKKVTVNGTVTQHQYFMYRGYQVIAAIDAATGNPDWLLVWDPAYASATRPLACCQGDQVYTYGFDLTKNVCELFDESGQIAASYDYAPYGALLQQTGNLTQPLQWSSEYVDGELGLVYYNYRHYNPRDGRWISRDPIGVQGGKNLYGFVGNRVSYYLDCCGLVDIDDILEDILESILEENEKTGDCYKFEYEGDFEFQKAQLSNNVRLIHEVSKDIIKRSLMSNPVAAKSVDFMDEGFYRFGDMATSIRFGYEIVINAEFECVCRHGGSFMGLIKKSKSWNVEIRLTPRDFGIRHLVHPETPLNDIFLLEDIQALRGDKLEKAKKIMNNRYQDLILKEEHQCQQFCDKKS